MVLDHWRDSTVLWVTHDVGETLAFERVLVVHAGRIVQDGVPAELKEEEGVYRALLDADDQVRESTWSRGAWRRLWLDDGAVSQRTDGDLS